MTKEDLISNNEKFMKDMQERMDVVSKLQQDILKIRGMIEYNGYLMNQLGGSDETTSGSCCGTCEASSCSCGEAVEAEAITSTPASP